MKIFSARLKQFAVADDAEAVACMTQAVNLLNRTFQAAISANAPARWVRAEPGRRGVGDSMSPTMPAKELFSD